MRIDDVKEADLKKLPTVRSRQMHGFAEHPKGADEVYGQEEKRENYAYSLIFCHVKIYRGFYKFVRFTVSKGDFCYYNISL